MSWRNNGQEQGKKLNLNAQPAYHGQFVQNQVEEQEITVDMTESTSNQLEDYIQNKSTIAGLQKRGIVNLFPIQCKTFKYIKNGQDIIARDKTGSGKTLGYALPLIERMREQKLFDTKQKGQKPYVVCILPTRELALQVSKEFINLCQNNEYRTLALYGGTMISEQIHEIKNGIEIVVGTPGRIIDLLNREILDFGNIRAVILDEADQMLNMGFQDDIERIYSCVTSEGQAFQNLLFSATIPNWVEDIARQYIKPDRVFIDLVKNSQNKTATGVEHLAIAIPFHLRTSTIGDVILCHGGHNCRTIIFTETKQEANDILLKAHIKQDCQVLHGDIPQKQREITFQGFREGKFLCLIATNVAARGLDIPQIDLIIQLDPPKDVENYIHRAGRTARAGRSGTCITFYTKKQSYLVDNLAKKANIKFKKIGTPQPEDIIKASVSDITDGLMTVEKEMLQHFQDGAKELIEKIGPEEALQRALAYISGYTKSEQVKQRSILSSFEGYITYIVKSQRPVRSFQNYWTFLKQVLSDKCITQIKGMKMFLDSKGVAFDLPQDFDDELEEFMLDQDVEANQGLELERATELPEIEDDGGNQQMGSMPQRSNYNSYGGGYHNEQSQKGGGYQGGGSFGQSQQSGGGLLGRGFFNNRTQNNEPQQQQYQSNSGGSDDYSLCLTSVSYDTTEHMIVDFFSKKGIQFEKGIKLLKDSETGNFKGIVFVKCQNEQMYQKMLDMNGVQFQDRNIRISKPFNKNN